MKVLIVAQHVNFFRNLDSVLRELCARGHEVAFLHGTRVEEDPARVARRKKVMLGRGLEVARSEMSGVTTGYRPEPTEAWCRVLRKGRAVLNRAMYLRKGHPSPDRVIAGIDKEVGPKWRRRFQSRIWRAALAQPAALSVWRWIEAASPPSETLIALLRDLRPDVALISPTIWPKEPVESDYIHAARSLGIPTLGYISSWDNLTSKGTLHVLPDLLIVWNQPLASEAKELHDVPRDLIRITGAPHVDTFFTLRRSASRADLCAQMGCQSDRPYIVYLCSSRTLITNEVPLVTLLADALARHFPNPPTIVVRPHPTHATPWERYEHAGVVVHPKEGDQADCPAAWQDYYDQLAEARCVFGLNTTAFLEAVVADRPCLTIINGEFDDVQAKTGHFRHLLAGDFLEVSRDVAEVATRVARILDGADEKAESRRAFARSFLRPCGIETPASTVVVDLIESAARSPVAVPGSASAGARRRDLVPGLGMSA